MVTIVAIPEPKAVKFETDMYFEEGCLFITTYDDKNKGKPVDFMVYTELDESGKLKGGIKYSVELDAEGEGKMQFTESTPPYLYIIQLKDKSLEKDKRILFHY